MSSLDTFSKTAQKLARNPLGIIALFIVLVYGIAGLVLSSSAATLESGERWPLIGFLVVFPVIVLAVFSWLVTKHHIKLYAPDDFPDKDGFFRALTPEEQKERLDAEVESVRKELPKDERVDDTVKGRFDLRSKLALVEELAIRDLEEKHNVTIKRQVATWGGGHVDGAFINPKDGREYAVEVKYTQRPDWRDLVRHAQHIPGLIRNEGAGAWVPLILYIVTDGVSEAQMKEAMEKLQPIMKSAPYPMTVTCISFDDLKKEYGFDEQTKS